jgi:hypothetical protein
MKKLTGNNPELYQKYFFLDYDDNNARENKFQNLGTLS